MDGTSIVYFIFTITHTLIRSYLHIFLTDTNARTQVILFGLPILLAVAVLSRLPWYIGLKFMISHAKADGWYDPNIHTVLGAFLWWITPQRLTYYFLLRAIRRCLVSYCMSAKVHIKSYSYYTRSMYTCIYVYVYRCRSST